jgi:hypothetical protein
VGLAIVVWFELREHRKELRAHRGEEVESRKTIMSLVTVVEKLVARFTKQDEAEAAALAASVAADAAAARVRDEIRKEISDVHERVSLSEDDDTPPLGSRARSEREKAPRAASSPYFYGPKKPDNR